MFVHMSIHYPHKSTKSKLRDSMHRFGKSLEKCDGFIAGYVLEDENSNKVIGKVHWESKEKMMANIHLAAEAVKNDDFIAWENAPPEVYYLHEV